MLMFACAGHDDPGDPGLMDVAQVRAEEAVLAEIALERALVERMIPDHALLTTRQPVVLSMDNIEADWVPRLDGVRIEVLGAAEIQARANREGDFLHLRFGAIRIDGDQASLTLENRWAVAAGSPRIHLSGGGFRMEFRRGPLGWTGEITVAWIS